MRRLSMGIASLLMAAVFAGCGDNELLAAQGDFSGPPPVPPNSKMKELKDALKNKKHGKGAVRRGSAPPRPPGS